MGPPTTRSQAHSVVPPSPAERASCKFSPEKLIPALIAFLFP